MKLVPHFWVWRTADIQICSSELDDIFSFVLKGGKCDSLSFKGKPEVCGKVIYRLLDFI